MEKKSYFELSQRDSEKTAKLELIHQCHRARETFVENMRRATSLIYLPAYAGLVGHTWADAMHIAHFEQYRGPLLRPAPKEVIDTIRQRAIEHMNDQMMSYSSDPERKMLTCMFQMVDEALDHTSGTILDSMDSMYSSLIILAWGAVEVLIEDLYNCVPKDASQKNGAKEFPRRLESAYDLYKKVFSEDGNRVVSALQSPAFVALSQTRHILVHCTGKIDAKFLDKTKDIASLASITKLGIGGRVVLDGMLVRWLIEDADAASAELIESVNYWLKVRCSN